MKKQLHDYEGYTAFERLEVAADRTNPSLTFDKLNENEHEAKAYDMLSKISNKADDVVHPAISPFNYIANAGWIVEDEVGFSGWKVVTGEGLGTNDKGKPRLSTVWETSWWHSIEPSIPRKLVGGPFKASLGDYHLGINALFYLQKFCPIIDYRITYDKPVKIGEVIENITTDVGMQNDQLQQECIQRIYGTDKIVGHCWTNHHVPEDKKDEV